MLGTGVGARFFCPASCACAEPRLGAVIALGCVVKLAGEGCAVSKVWHRDGAAKPLSTHPSTGDS